MVLWYLVEIIPSGYTCHDVSVLCGQGNSHKTGCGGYIIVQYCRRSSLVPSPPEVGLGDIPSRNSSGVVIGVNVGAYPPYTLDVLTRKGLERYGRSIHTIHFNYISYHFDPLTNSSANVHFRS